MATSGRPVLLPYKILVSLLYGEFDFIEREYPLIILPTNLFCAQLKITPRQLQQFLDFLELSDIIVGYKWMSYSVHVEVRPPKGMGFILNKDLSQFIGFTKND